MKPSTFIIACSCLLFSLIINVGSCDDNKKTRIAVCVTGQLGRLIPQYLHQLIGFNAAASKAVEFHLFHQLSFGPVVYNTLNGYYNSEYQNLSPHEAVKKLHKFYKPLINNSSLVLHEVELINATYSVQDRRKYWQNIFERVGLLDRLHEYYNSFFKRGSGQLDRIHLYKREQSYILDMYEKQVKCISQITKWEMKNKVETDYIISTREDLYVFKPFNILELIKNHHSCDLIAKNCLSWGGINMRFQLYTRLAGTRMLHTRLSFYRYLQNIDVKVSNPEIYEKMQAEWLKLSVCSVSIEDLPIAASRPYSQNASCLILHEYIDNCYPQNVTFNKCLGRRNKLN